MFRSYLFLIILIFSNINLVAQQPITITNVANGWANNSVNTVIFRKNSLTSFRGYQYIAFYDSAQNVVLGKRKTGSSLWQLQVTQYKGNASDAHNSISIIADGSGYLHLAWDHHNVSLRYARSVAPGSLQMSDKMPMTGLIESKVSYPEFYRMPNGDLLFLYRNGASGNGSLVMNRYDLKTSTWIQVQQNLIDGENKRNAYWQACVDAKGSIHLSWVWRETGDVASNHDLCYARSDDGGLSWQRSDGTKYQLPINAANAEYICRIPQQSDLINQTSITTDHQGQPMIATYYKEATDSVPQYHLIFLNKNKWQVLNTGFNKSPFHLGGTGTKRIPVSRPQVISWKENKKTAAAIIFRDAGRGDLVSIAINHDIHNSNWKVQDLVKEPVGSWEPSFDTNLWSDKKVLSLFIQKTEQIDGEGKADIPAQMVKVLDCTKAVLSRKATKDL